MLCYGDICGSNCILWCFHGICVLIIYKISGFYDVQSGSCSESDTPKKTPGKLDKEKFTTSMLFKHVLIPCEHINIIHKKIVGWNHCFLEFIWLPSFLALFTGFWPILQIPHVQGMIAEVKKSLITSKLPCRKIRYLTLCRHIFEVSFLSRFFQSWNFTLW